MTAIVAMLLAAATAAAQTEQSASGSISGAAQSVCLPVAGVGSGVVQLTGTWIGVVTFKGSADVAGTLRPVMTVEAGGSLVPGTTASANGLYLVGVAGLQKVCAEFTTYVSGTAGVTIRASASTQLVTPTATGASGGVGLTDTQLRASAVPVSASSLPLPTGAATAANQATQATAANQTNVQVSEGATTNPAKLQAIAGRTQPFTVGVDPAWKPIPLTEDAQRVQVDLTNQSVAVSSSALPTGAATEATLSSINTKTPALVSGRQPVDGSGVTQPVSGSVTANAGTNLNTSALALSATQTDRTQKAQVTDGTRDGTVKAASTAAAAADTSLVVGLSPNSPLPAGTNALGKLTANSGVIIGDVNVVGSLPAGTNGIGKLTANTGVTIGAVEIAAAQTLATVTTVSTVTNVATIGTSVTPGTGAANLGKAEDAAAASGDTGVAVLLQRKDTNATLTSADGDYVVPAADNYGAAFVRLDHPNRIRCTVTVSTATAITAVGGSCVAPGAGLSLYVTDIEFSASAAGIAADAFPTLKYGTGGTCGTGTTVFWGALTAAAIRADHTFATPIKIPANSEICWISTTAGSKFVVISGYIAP